MVEARQRVDQFDRDIPSEGVIVYRVQTSDPLGHARERHRAGGTLTSVALVTGQAFTSDTGVTVNVINALPGGFSITVDDPTNTLTTVPDVIQTFAPEALGLIQAAGLVPKFTGANPTKKNWVFSQSPLAGHIVAGGSTVTMVLHTGPLP